MHARHQALAVALITLALAGGRAAAAGGYAGIDGSSRPVPTPTYRMFSGQPYIYVAPASPTFNRHFAPNRPSAPRRAGQPHR